MSRRILPPPRPAPPAAPQHLSPAGLITPPQPTHRDATRHTHATPHDTTQHNTTRRPPSSASPSHLQVEARGVHEAQHDFLHAQRHAPRLGLALRVHAAPALGQLHGAGGVRGGAWRAFRGGVRAWRVGVILGGGARQGSWHSPGQPKCQVGFRLDHPLSSDPHPTCPPAQAPAHTPGGGCTPASAA